MAPERQNIEVKARYPELNRAREVCAHIGASFQGVLNQIDTYFHVESGRLKLRQINHDRAELIEYIRPNHATARSSRYKLTPLNVEALQTVLSDFSAKHGVRVVVRKKRELWLWENVRIHLDEGEGLGSFIEFEGVVGPDADEVVSRRRVDRLVGEFGIRNEDQIGESYSDLLERARLRGR
jgi:predicted adenylyl cyclase CyaB